MSVRPPAVSGRFYPSDPVELRATVATLLADARRPHPLTPSPPPERGNVRAVIAPHAGYLYSGPTAAAVFTRVTIPGLVIILAPNHTGVCEADFGVSLWDAGAFQTPLGDVRIDARVAGTLLDISRGIVAVDHDAHRAEHAVEVQLPFLQMLRPDVRILPLVIAWDVWDAAQALGDLLVQLVKAVDEPALLLASSDMNHYEPAAVSERKDARALDAVVRLDGAELLARCKQEHITMCGRGPAAVAIHCALALGARRAEVVDYRHSGWVSGDNARVVGYAGVLIP